MNAEGLMLIEGELDIELPSSYKEFMTNYPSKLLEKGVHAAEVEIIKSPQRLIDLNKQIDSSQSLDLDPSYFCIGESGCGDYYFIDTDIEDSPVYFWNHEIGAIDDREESGSLIAHAGRIIEVYEYIKGTKKQSTEK